MTNSIEVTLLGSESQRTVVHVPIDKVFIEEARTRSAEAKRIKSELRRKRNEELFEVARKNFLRKEYKEALNSYPQLVYGVKYGNRIKVGVTTNSESLLAGYHRLVPDTKMIWSIPGNNILEKTMHSLLEDYNIPHQSGVASEVFEISEDEQVCIDILDATLERALNG